MNFNWGRQILYALSKNHFARIFVIFFKNLFHATQSFNFPCYCFSGENSSENFIQFLKHKKETQKIYWLESFNQNKDNEKFKKLFEEKQINYYLNQLKNPIISQKNIDLWEIEAAIFNTNALLVYGDDFLQIQSRAFNTQCGTKKPFVYYELANLIKYTLPSYYSLNNSVSDGSTFSKSSFIFHPKKIISLSDAKLIPECTVFDSNLFTKNDQITKQKICCLLINAIESYLSKNPCPFTKTQVVGSIEILLKNLQSEKINLTEINACSLMIGSAIAYTNLGWIDIMSYSIFSQFKTPIYEVKPTLFLHFIKTLIDYKNHSENYYFLQYLLDEIYGVKVVSVESFYQTILNIFKSCGVLDTIKNKSNNSFNHKSVKRILKDSFHYFSVLFSDNFHDVRKTMIKKVIYSVFNKPLY